MGKIVTLYKRNAQNKIVTWQIHRMSDSTITINHGIFAGKKHLEIIDVTAKKVDEFTSRINAKRKEGYKALEDLYDNSPSEIPHKEGIGFDQNLFEYLNTYLPKYNTTSEGFILPMLAKTLEDNKPFEKYGIMRGQWKINGLRCIIGAEKNDMDLFKPISLTYHSRTGENWTPKMSWMDEIILPKLNYELVERMIEEGVCLDGELYLPGYSVNDINSFVKNPTLPQHYLLQYWCYDLACENMDADSRCNFRFDNINISDKINHWFISKEEHLNNKRQFVLLHTIDVKDFAEAIGFRNRFIDLGFEGLILRNPHAEYAFGKRNQSMFKFKKKEDGKFKIIDIKEDKRGLPIFILKNDINDELFECTINLPQYEQKLIFNSKEYIILNNLALVEYRERSGKAFVPFHAKIVKLLKK